MQVVETSVTVNNSPIQDYTHLDDHIPPTYEMTPGFRPFTVKNEICRIKKSKNKQNFDSLKTFSCIKVTKHY